MTGDAPAVYLITGPMAAGKSTVARLLAGRPSRGVHLEGDFFRRSIVSGREEMAPDPSAEAIAQLRLRYRLAISSALAYVDEGFTVAFEDVIAGSLLEECAAQIRSRRVGLWLDTTDLSPEESVDAILSHTAAAPG